MPLALYIPLSAHWIFVDCLQQLGVSVAVGLQVLGQGQGPFWVRKLWVIAHAEETRQAR